MDVLGVPLKAAVFGQSIGVVYAVLEGLANARVVRIESTPEGVFIKCLGTNSKQAKKFPHVAAMSSTSSAASSTAPLSRCSVHSHPATSSCSSAVSSYPIFSRDFLLKRRARGSHDVGFRLMSCQDLVTCEVSNLETNDAKTEFAEDQAGDHHELFEPVPDDATRFNDISASILDSCTEARVAVSPSAPCLATARNRTPRAPPSSASALCSLGADPWRSSTSSSACVFAQSVPLLPCPYKVRPGSVAADASYQAATTKFDDFLARKRAKK